MHYPQPQKKTEKETPAEEYDPVALLMDWLLWALVLPCARMYTEVKQQSMQMTREKAGPVRSWQWAVEHEWHWPQQP